MNKTREYPAGCSVLIPSSRVGPDLQESLETICRSLARLRVSHEILIVVDRSAAAGDPFAALAERYTSVKILRPAQKLGGPAARYHALCQARFRTLFFTDDDVWAPIDWAERLYALVQERGIVSGLVQGRGQSLIDRCESLIDLYRLNAKDSESYAKFLSFPNFGIQRELLPTKPFEPNVEYNLGSLDLGNQLRLQGYNIFTEQSLVVYTNYPKTIKEAFARKLRHAKGIAYVHARLGDEAWQKLEMGTHGEIIRRWIKISFNAPLAWYERFFFLSLNLSYALSLAVFYALERKPHRD